MTQPNPREEKLPHWARTLLADLRSENRQLHGVLAQKEELLAQQRGEAPADSDTFLDTSETGLGRGTVIGFKPRNPDAREGSQWATAAVDAEGRLMLDCGGRWVVIPHAQNVVELRIEDHHRTRRSLPEDHPRRPKTASLSDLIAEANGE